MGATDEPGGGAHSYRQNAAGTRAPEAPLRLDDVFGVWVMRLLGALGVFFVGMVVAAVSSSFVLGGDGRRPMCSFANNGAVAISHPVRPHPPTACRRRSALATGT